MKNHCFTVLCWLGLLAASGAQAVGISAGTAEYVTVRNCIPGALTACDDVSPVVTGQYGGLPGDATSSASVSLAGYGAAAGSVALSGVAGAPILKSAATSEVGARLNTNSVAVQRYVYAGTASTVRTFGGLLEYAQVSTGAYPTGPGAGIHAALDVFTLSNSTIEVGSTARENFNTLFGAYVDEAGYASLGSASFDDAATNPGGSGSLSVTVTLNPGDAVWIWAIVQTPATNGGWVDASHTFVTGWSDASNLLPAAVAVPEPGMLALWLAGGLGVVAASRRRRVGV